MIVLGYTHNHKGDGFARRFARELIRVGQVGYKFRRVTHTEMVLSGVWSSADIASSSLMDGGVRTRRGVRLNPAHWMAISVPGWDAQQSAQWFDRHDGDPYDSRGALGSVLYGLGHDEGWFCNEACGASVGQVDPHSMPPAGFIALALRQPGARLVTAEFFSTTKTGTSA